MRFEPNKETPAEHIKELQVHAEVAKFSLLFSREPEEHARLAKNLAELMTITADTAKMPRCGKSQKNTLRALWRVFNSCRNHHIKICKAEDLYRKTPR